MPSIQPEDTALWLNLLHEGYEAKGIQQVLAKYRIVTNSVSRNKKEFSVLEIVKEQERLNSVQIFTILVSMLIMLIKNKINVVGKTQL